MRVRLKMRMFSLQNHALLRSNIFAVFAHQQAGDEITLVKKIDDEWYIGRLGNQEGMFPVKFVEIIEDLPEETEPETKVVFAKLPSLLSFHLYSSKVPECVVE